jgi:predicted nucleic acid-binding protein
MIILDTNVLSALMRKPADLAVTAWLDRHPRSSIWTSSVTILEIRYGLGIMSNGRRRDALLVAFERLTDEKLEQRVADFDQAAAAAASALMVARKKRGEPGDLRDTMIAGIVIARRAVLATGNVKHFFDAGVEIVNPWDA